MKPTYLSTYVKNLTPLVESVSASSESKLVNFEELKGHALGKATAFLTKKYKIDGNDRKGIKYYFEYKLKEVKQEVNDSLRLKEKQFVIDSLDLSKEPDSIGALIKDILIFSALDSLTEKGLESFPSEVECDISVIEFFDVYDSWILTKSGLEDLAQEYGLLFDSDTGDFVYDEE